MTEQKTVLYIEDNPHNRRLVRRALEHCGFSVVEATDGPSGMAMVQDIVPPLILLDIGLPGIDGVEILTRIRADAKLHHIPVIVVTASVMSGDRERFLAAGCNDYLSKPIDVPKLLEKVAQHYPKE